MNYFILTILILLSTNSWANKIAYIDLDSTLEQLYDYDEINKLVAKYVNQKNKQLDYEYASLEKMKQDYLSKNDPKILQSFNQKEAIYQKKSKKFQEEINQYAQDQKVPLLRKLIKFSQNYAVQHKIDVLLDSNKSILYEKQEVKDISNEILKAYNSNKNK